jgi:hypothetical protein
MCAQPRRHIRQVLLRDDGSDAVEASTRRCDILSLDLCPGASWLVAPSQVRNNEVPLNGEAENAAQDQERRNDQSGLVGRF